MAKRVPTNFPYASAHCCGFNLSPQDVLLRARSTKSISENPIICPRAWSLRSSQFQQRVSECRTQRERFPRSFGFCVSDPAIHDTSPYQNGLVLPVEITPL